MTSQSGNAIFRSNRRSVLAGLLGLGFAGTTSALAQESTPPAGTPVASPEAVVVTEPVITPMMRAEIAQLPQAPFTVRLLRITLQPGSITPMHTHHGPEIDLVESGEITIRSLGEAPVTRADGTEEVSSGEEMLLVAGDMVHFPAEVGMFFENTGTDVAEMMSAVIIPVGPDYVNERITWIDGEPSLEGISYQKFGDGLIQEMPQQAAEWLVNKIELPAAAAMPALDGISMITPVQGNMSFSIDAGQVQITRADSNMLQPNAVLGTSVSLGDADAAFFPNGATETARNDEEASLTYIAMDIVPVDGVVSTPATLTFNAGDGTIAGGPGEPKTGQIVTTNTDDVNLRDEPSVDGEVIDQLSAGIELEVLDGPVDADDYVWYQVRVNTEGGSEGWMVADFLDGLDASVAGDGTSGDGNATPAAKGKFPVDSKVVTIEAGVRLRPEASTETEAIDALPIDTELTVTGATVEAEDHTWLPVKTADGIAGFVTIDFIEAVP